VSSLAATEGQQQHITRSHQSLSRSNMSKIQASSIRNHCNAISTKDAAWESHAAYAHASLLLLMWVFSAAQHQCAVTTSAASGPPPEVGHAHLNDGLQR
jgi:hypothetical protein